MSAVSLLRSSTTNCANPSKGDGLYKFFMKGGDLSEDE